MDKLLASGEMFNIKKRYFLAFHGPRVKGINLGLEFQLGDLQIMQYQKLSKNQRFMVASKPRSLRLQMIASSFTLKNINVTLVAPEC